MEIGEFNNTYRKWSIKHPGRLFNFRTKRGGGRLIDTRRLLEGGVYFLSKVTHSNHRNKLTALLNSNNFHTTFAESTLINMLLTDEVVYMLFILRKTSVIEKKISGIYM